MSYQVLARKWRPKSFADVVGQQHVLTVLTNGLSLGRIHHAYLFSGTRGVGKTSIARLLAKGLNCETGMTDKPCGKCDNCIDIEKGRFIDLLEIDAASRTKVEDTREILDNIQYLPTKGRFKVYLIDEVHMLSRSSFNALLKTLEEPPEHIKFLLATTDPQKLPITILSRCLHLHLSALDTDLIKNQLHKILSSENIEFEDRATQLLAKAANGSMRDALSLTDQSIALGNGKITVEPVSTMLGILDKTIPFSLITTLSIGDGNQLMEQLQFAAKQGVDWDGLLVETLALLHQISVLQIVPTAFGEYSDQQEKMKHLAQTISPNDVQLFYQILLMGRKELAFSPDKKIGVEMSFLRALAFTPKQFQSNLVNEQNNIQVKNEIEDNTQVNISKKTINSLPNRFESSIEKISDDHIETENTQIQESIKNESEQSTSDISNLTQNILSARQRIIDTKNTNIAASKVKKSEQVEQVQPKTFIKDKKIAITEQKSANQEILEKNEIESAETYQWQFSKEMPVNTNPATSVKNLKKAFQHEKTPELNQKLIEESVKIDSWSAEIESMSLPPLIKQIAVNSFIENKDGNHLILHLRSPLEHLIRTGANVKKLAEILSTARAESCNLVVEIDDDPSQKTPLEIREMIYQKKLSEAKQSIIEDEKVAMICQIFDAKIDEESIRPV